MPTASHSISQLIQQSASKAGLALFSAGAGVDFNGAPTARLELKSTSGSTYQLETSESLSAAIEQRPGLLEELSRYLDTLAKRLRAPHPDVFLTLHGLPISMQQFRWPYHHSTSGADCFILHGVVQLAEKGSPLHAKVAASMTVTLAQVVPALEQPFAEAVTFNAIRKTMDLGQLELLKSGNRQPVPVSTRYYSFRQNRFIFTETDQAKRAEFLRKKVFWISERLGERGAAWIADPYDAQYLDCSTEDLRTTAQELAKEEWVTLESSGEYAVATAKLAAESEVFLAQMESALALLKPKFNEAMRAGHTNM